MRGLRNTSVVRLFYIIHVLKGWGLHPLDDLATFAEVLEQFKRGEIEGCSSFVFSDTLLEQPFECYIAPNLSGPFQRQFSAVPEWGRYVHAFGRFFKNGFFCFLKWFKGH